MENLITYLIIMAAIFVARFFVEKANSRLSEMEQDEQQQRDTKSSLRRALQEALGVEPEEAGAENRPSAPRSELERRLQKLEQARADEPAVEMPSQSRPEPVRSAPPMPPQRREHRPRPTGPKPRSNSPEELFRGPETVPDGQKRFEVSLDLDKSRTPGMWQNDTEGGGRTRRVTHRIHIEPETTVTHNRSDGHEIRLEVVHSLLDRQKGPDNLRRAVLWSEIIGPPVAHRNNRVLDPKNSRRHRG